ncbi:MAG: hypothetical protein ACKVON_07830, partial [Beijerinckiaceae bacterium]
MDIEGLRQTGEKIDRLMDRWPWSIRATDADRMPEKAQTLFILRVRLPERQYWITNDAEQ